VPALADPFAADGVWLRCALHAHTTNSDGELPPTDLVRHYEDAGYDVLVVTDHWFRTDAPSTDRLLVLPGAELNARAPSRADDAHVLGFGIASDPVVPELDFPTLAETVDWIVEQGGVPYLAHPRWSGLRTAQFEDCDGLVGVEVWNAGCELEVGRGDSTSHWDEALESGRRLFGIATDDAHRPGVDSRHAWTWVRAPERSADAVLGALRDGLAYGSTGPEIVSAAVDADDVVVRCSPAASVTLFTGRAVGARANAAGDADELTTDAEVVDRDATGALTAVRLRRPWHAPYGRVEVADGRGRRAWTNPLWLD
jgi:hypothetical protein